VRMSIKHGINAGDIMAQHLAAKVGRRIYDQSAAH